MLRPGGLVVFTLEHAVGGEADVDCRLEWHGRSGHTRANVERVPAIAGLGPVMAHAELRLESGLPVAGLVIRATKPATRSLRRSGDPLVGSLTST